MALRVSIDKMYSGMVSLDLSLSISKGLKVLLLPTFCLNLHNTLHLPELRCPTCSAHLGANVSCTRSSDPLTYFIKNTWDSAQTGSLFLSLFLPGSSHTYHHHAPRWAAVTTFHSFSLRAIPTFISLCVSNVINTPLHSEKHVCIH